MSHKEIVDYLSVALSLIIGKKRYYYLLLVVTIARDCGSAIVVSLPESLMSPPRSLFRLQHLSLAFEYRHSLKDHQHADNIFHHHLKF